MNPRDGGELKHPKLEVTEILPTTQHVSDREWTLKEMQTAVGGLIELVTLRDGKHLICNEEGLLRSLPINEEASQLAGRMIVGNAIVFSGKAKLK